MTDKDIWERRIKYAVNNNDKHCLDKLVKQLQLLEIIKDIFYFDIPPSELIKVVGKYQ